MVIIGLAMVVGAIINAWEWLSNQVGHLLVSPLFYVGILLIVAGVVVLMGDEKTILALKGNKKIGGWALVLIGAVVSVWRFIGSLEPIKRTGTYYIYPETRIHDFFQQFFLNPILYVGIALIVAGLVIIKRKKKPKVLKP